MKDQKVLFTLLLCLLGFFIASCNAIIESETYPTPTPYPIPEWLTKFLETPTCPPPCWEYITPGQTNFEQAKLFIQRHPDVQGLYTGDVIPFGKTLRWPGGSVPVNDEGVVQMVWLTTSKYKVSVDSLISRYGDPKYVVFSYWYESVITVDLLYPDIGLVVSLGLAKKGPGPEVVANILPKSVVSGILFLAPGLEYYYDTMVRMKPIRQYDWNGYQTYP
jgi:hypothetical protein